MVTDKTLVHGTHNDPRLIARARVALTLATEDNMDRTMTDLEQSRKNVAQLKETLKKLLQLQLFPKFFKILDPPFNFILPGFVWDC